MTAPSSRPRPLNRPAIVGHRGIRGAILVELKKSRRLTAKDLAAKLAISLNAVRHHLKELEAEALVEYERQHRGVGAPAFAYQLTSAGGELFPRRYEATLSDLLDHVVEREGRAGAVAALEARYAALTRRLQQELAGASPAERMAALARLLTDDGYMAEADASAGSGTLIEHNCAVQAVAERFPEICAAEARFLSAVLGAEVQRQEHILSGCSACEYRVHFNASGPQATSPASPSQGQA
ncbi:MAG TPA: winged helix-turn-helix transcriptional regulator [Gemmatimonadales bacterium]|nr:winged helix-turn-helix transcriptional regulator [Gemmatimonadales bacterium]